jgi:hypothetical protein
MSRSFVVIAGAVVLVAAILAAACGGEGDSGGAPDGPSSTASPSAPDDPSPTASPSAQDGTSTPGAGTCAAGSRDAFLDVQEEAPFTVYCPTNVPEDFALTSLDFDVPPVATPEPDLGFFTAFFTHEETGDTIEFVQGNASASWEALILRQREGQTPEEIPYGDFTVDLYPGVPEEGADFMAPAVFGHSPDGWQHYITASDLDGDALKAIAESMVPVTP